jgi:N-acyl-D-amino-acid deacylase
MTGMPAKTIGLKRRGTIAEGNIADLVVFDTARVRDKATFAKPHLLAEGFDHVIVNGSLARSTRFDSIAMHGHILNAHNE